MNNVQGEKVNVFQILIFEILLLLPVRSLLRFRCVCKEWCELIDSRLFKDTYLSFRRAMSVDDQIVGLKSLLIEIPSTYEYMGPDDSVDDEVGFPDDIVRTIFKYSMTCWYGDYKSLVQSASAPSSSNIFQIPSNYPDPIRIVSHVNGVVCLIHGDNWFDITLVNPALQEIRKLPNPMFDLSGLDKLRRVYTLRTGFGYDDVGDDYKVVVIVTVLEEEDLYKHIGIVYHLSTNSWKILGDMSEFVSRPFERLISHESVFSHGFIHWCVGSLIDDCKPCYWILAFDVTNELFREIPFPRSWRSFSVYDDNGMSPHLFMVDKSTIALVNSTRQRWVVPKLEVWVMNDYSDSDSWTKQNSINNLPEFGEAISFWKKDKLLILSDGLGLICYDLFKRQLDLDELAEIPIRGSDFVTGHESFVSVKQV